jgi:hypothetical protein
MSSSIYPPDIPEVGWLFVRSSHWNGVHLCMLRWIIMFTWILNEIIQFSEKVTSITLKNSTWIDKAFESDRSGLFPVSCQPNEWILKEKFKMHSWTSSHINVFRFLRWWSFVWLRVLWVSRFWWLNIDRTRFEAWGRGETRDTNNDNVSESHKSNF